MARQRTRFTRLNRKWQSIEENRVPDFQYSHAKATPRNQSGRNVAAWKWTAANTAPDINAETAGNAGVLFHDLHALNFLHTDAIIHTAIPKHATVAPKKSNIEETKPHPTVRKSNHLKLRNISSSK